MSTTQAAVTQAAATQAAATQAAATQAATQAATAELGPAYSQAYSQFLRGVFATFLGLESRQRDLAASMAESTAPILPAALHRVLTDLVPNVAFNAVWSALRTPIDDPLVLVGRLATVFSCYRTTGGFGRYRLATIAETEPERVRLRMFARLYGTEYADSTQYWNAVADPFGSCENYLHAPKYTLSRLVEDDIVPALDTEVARRNRIMAIMDADSVPSAKLLNRDYILSRIGRCYYPQAFADFVETGSLDSNANWLTAAQNEVKRRSDLWGSHFDVCDQTLRSVLGDEFTDYFSRKDSDFGCSYWRDLLAEAKAKFYAATATVASKPTGTTGINGVAAAVGPTAPTAATAAVTAVAAELVARLASLGIVDLDGLGIPLTKYPRSWVLNAIKQRAPPAIAAMPLAAMEHIFSDELPMTGDVFVTIEHQRRARLWSGQSTAVDGYSLAAAMEAGLFDDGEVSRRYGHTFADLFCSSDIVCQSSEWPELLRKAHAAAHAVARADCSCRADSRSELADLKTELAGLKAKMAALQQLLR